MKITETVKNVSYTNGRRIATIEQNISRSDDCEHIGTLYYRLSDIYRRMDNNDISTEEQEALEKDIIAVKEELNTYLGYLSGYSD